MVSVADILSLRSLALEPVTVPHPDAGVRWVATSELVDPSPFLEGGEIVLTTGLVERDSDEWHRFVSSLVGAGVVALGFAVGLSHPDVPSGLRDAALAGSLNLFVVPRPTPFIAVSRAVADQLWGSEREADRQSLLHQQTLTAAAMGGASTLVSALAGITSGAVALCTADAAVLASSGWSADDLAARVLPHIKRLQAAGIRGAATEITPESRLSVQPVGAGTVAEAYLVVESHNGASSAQRTAVTTALALLGLDRARAQAELEQSTVRLQLASAKV